LIARWDAERRGGITHIHISRPPQRHDSRRAPRTTLLTPALHLAVPIIQIPFQPREAGLHGRTAHVLPGPAGEQGQDTIEDVAPAAGVEGRDQLAVDAVDERAEILFGDAGRIEDLGVEVGEGGRQVALEHPVAADADDACGVVERRGDGHVRVWVWEAGVRGSPFFGGVGGGTVRTDDRGVVGGEGGPEAFG